jgi:hypothetical protein
MLLEGPRSNFNDVEDDVANDEDDNVYLNDEYCHDYDERCEVSNLLERRGEVGLMA